MKVYMADYGWGFMVSRNLRQTYLQEVGLMQISGDHGFFNIYFLKQDIF